MRSSCSPPKANKDCWKGKFALFWMLATEQWGECGWMHVQRPAPPPQQSRGKSLYRMREGAMCWNSRVSSDGHLEIGGLTSIILIVLRPVNLQFRVQFVPISLRPICGSVAAYGFPWWLCGKESTCNAGDTDMISGLGRSHGEENSNSLQYHCLGNPMDRGAWQATVHGTVRVGHNFSYKTTITTPRL